MSDKNIFETINSYRGQAPVDVYGLIKFLGIEVKHKSLDDNLSGEIEHQNGKFKITVNNTHVSTRQRFTAAHELGHYVYHRPLMGDGISDNKMYRTCENGKFNNPNITTVEETEANQFAAYLLMPDNLINQFINEGLTSDEIADRLQVSRQAMSIKLNSMGNPHARPRANVIR